MTHPFADILRPLCDEALEDLSLAAETAGVPGIVQRAVSDGLRPLFVQRLSAVAAPTLFAAFETVRPAPPPIAALLDEPPEDVSRAAYAAFADGMAAGGLDRLRQSHPGLDKAISLLIEHNSAAALELAIRLQQDGTALRGFVPGWAAAMPALSAIGFGLSDPHADGRMVASLAFADGTKLAYKPRSLAVEAGFAGLLDWLATRNPKLPDQRLPRVLDRGSHGWMEWVEPAACRDAGEVPAFYRRLGMLMAALGLLRGTDIHSENLIAAGAYPVIVDLECLLAPDAMPDWLKRLSEPPPFMESGLLPFLVPLGEGRWRNIGSGGPPLPPEPLQDYGFRHAGTDWMRRATIPRLPEEHNLPRLDGAEQDIRGHLPALGEGYRLMLETVLAHRAGFLAEDGPLPGFAAARCRFVALPTDSYRRLLVRLREPDMAASPDAVARQAARIARPAIPGIAEADWRKLLAAEAEALGRGDVPAFLFHPSDGSLSESSGTPVGRLGDGAPLEAARQAVRALDEKAAARHEAVLRGAFAPAPLPTGSDGGDLLDRLADWLVGRAIPRSDGGVDWLRPHEELPISIRIAGRGLYHGNAGIALALAAAGRHRLRTDWLDLARQALLPLRRLAADGAAQSLAWALGTGHAVGLGGMIASLVWAGDLLEEPGYVADALCLAERLGDPAGISAFDFYDGIAGLLPALHLLGRHSGSRDLPPLIARWADRLLALSEIDGAARIWRPRRGQPVAGLAHGQSGMAVALACAFDATGEERYLAAARAALLWEDRLFDATAGNWPDPNGQGISGRGRPTTAWCHGAPGVALARAALLKLAPKAFADRRAELARALATTAGEAVGEAGDLCCGFAGRLSVLALAGADITTLHETARRRWSSGTPGLWSDALPFPAPDPCLFKGVAGIVLALVQVEAPRLAPPVLLPALA